MISATDAQWGQRDVLLIVPPVIRWSAPKPDRPGESAEES